MGFAKINRDLLLRGALAGMLAGAVAFGGGASVLAKPRMPTTGIVRRDIAVTTVDPTAEQRARGTNPPNAHMVLVPEQAKDRKGKLFLYLVGSGTAVSSAEEIPFVGARRGYNVISLAYPNYQAVASLCQDNPDKNCTGKVREEIITGVDLSPLVSVAPKDALETRLQKLLVYLRATYPTEGWNKFLKGSEVRWGQISVAGHSQGAGHTAYLVKRHAFYRATMLSGVADWDADEKPATWVYMPNKTPVSRVYAFAHVRDTFARFEQDWNVMHLKGPVTSVDGAKAPYGGSHQLSTALMWPGATNFHSGIVSDDLIPRDADQTPVFLPVWNFALFP